MVETRSRSTRRGATTLRIRAARSGRAAIVRGATAFVDGYLEALRTLQPGDVGRAPCLAYGRGAVAYTLLKASFLRGDRTLLAAARRWAAVSLRSARRSHVWQWPKASFSRGLTGLHALQALAAHAGNDHAACRRELRRFVESSRRGRGSIELFQGMAGRLAGAGIVLRRIPDPAVRALGDDLAARILAALEARGPRPAPLGRGVVHGWPGVVLSVLAWQAVSRSLPEDVLRRAVLSAHPYDVASPYFRWQVDWAHGHAGMAQLFARAYGQLGDRRFLAWARAAAARAYVQPLRGGGLLDGNLGIAYAMLAVAAVDPEGPWRDVAWTLAGHVLASADLPEHHPYGLWYGLGGVCCLALDLLHETDGAFPGIEA